MLRGGRADAAQRQRASGRLDVGGQAVPGSCSTCCHRARRCSSSRPSRARSPHLAGLEAREAGGVRARDPRHGGGDRGLRRRGRARAGTRRSVRDEHPVRRPVHLRALGARTGGDRDELPPHRGHAQPGGAGARPGEYRGGLLAVHRRPFVVFMVSPLVGDELLRAQIGYFRAAALLPPARRGLPGYFRSSRTVRWPS